MKRLIPAAIILVFVVSICIGAHIYVDRECDRTLNDIKKYRNKDITASELEDIWKERKENMSLFVNHGFLDNLSIYIGRLSIISDNDSLESNTACKNIETVLSLIKAEQKFGLHSLY